MTALKHRIARRLLKITPAQVEEKVRFGNYIEMVTAGIPFCQRATRGRIESGRKKVTNDNWFTKYI